MTKLISNSLEETQKIANDFVNSISQGEALGATIVGLYGELGAGKTTLTQMIAKSFGVSDIVTSPTFVIMKVYELNSESQKNTYFVQHRVLNKIGFEHLVHIDAYRIENSSELLHLGWQEIISDPGNLILIEWPERVSDIMPDHIKINLKTLENESSRELDIIL